MELKAKNVCYNPITRTLYFESDNKNYEMKAKEVLELAYGLLDMYRADYDILEDLDYKINGGE